MHRAIRIAFFFALAYCIIYAAINSASKLEAFGTLTVSVKQLAKVGGFLLAFLIGGAPLMACMLPSGALTPEEQACCRRMAHRCGDHRMPSSHSCCKTVGPPDQTAVSKSSFKLTYQAQLLYVAQAIAQLPEPPQHTFATSAVPGHSPPETPPSSFDILRI
jgi:hypothetical protein